MSVSIELRSVGLDYPVYSVRAQSLRNAVFTMAVGGRLMKTQQDITVVRALTNVDLDVAEGDRLALIGHNGSGKTSLLKVLAGVYEPTSGAMDIHGQVTSMISMSIGLDPDASGLRNIRNILMMQLLSKKEIDERLPAIVDFSELGAFIHMPFKTYSAGMMARLTFAVGTELQPDIMVMDEWLSAGDVAFREKAAHRMENLVGAAKIVVIATHDFGLVKRLCNKVMVLEGGQPTFFGPTQDWIRQSAAA